MGYNLFLDDDNQRTPYKVSSWFPKEYIAEWNQNLWERVWNYDQFVKIIKCKGLPERVSFDHDLADEHYAVQGGTTNYNKFAEKTGYHCMQWMIDYIIDNNLEPPKVFVHSMNPVGRENIAALFNNFLKHYQWDNSRESAILTDK